MKKVIVSILIALICISSVFAAHSKTEKSVTIGDVVLYEVNDYKVSIAKDSVKKAIETAFNGDPKKSLIEGVAKAKSNITELVIGRGIKSSSEVPAGSVFIKWIEEPYCAAYITTHPNGERTLTFYTYGDVKVVFPADCTDMFTEKTLTKEIAQKIQHIDLSQADMSDVKKAEKLCNNMKALTDIDLPKNEYRLGADSTKDLNVKEMFKSCSNLESFDLSAVNISAVSQAKGMFQSCSSLSALYCDTATGDALSAKSSGNGFNDKFLEGCTSLVGTVYNKDGTVFNSSKFTTNWKSMLTYGANGLLTNLDGITGIMHGLVLDGQIKLYFNILNDIKYITCSSLYMKCPLYSSYSGTYEVELLNSSAFLPYNEGMYYRFSVPVAASQMGKKIIFRFNNAETPLQVSIKDLAEDYINSDKSSPSLQNLCTSMLNYGALAQLYFRDAENKPIYTPDSGDNPLVVKNPQIDLTSISFEGMTSSPVYVYKYNNVIMDSMPEITDFGARFLGNSLVCYSDLRIRHSFKFADGLTWDDFEVTMSTHKEPVYKEDGTTIDTYDDIDDALFSLEVEDVASQPGQKRYYIEVSDFPAAEFNKDYTVTMTSVADPTMSFSIKYSPMSYVNGAINKSDDDGLKQLCGGIYWFYKAADAYFNAVEE